MNTRPIRSRLGSWLRYFLVLGVSLAAVHLLFWLTGFGAWLRETPIAVATVRVIAILFLGGGSLAIFFTRDPEFHTLTYRLSAAFCLLIAILQIAALVTGAQTPSDLFVTE